MIANEKKILELHAFNIIHGPWIVKFNICIEDPMEFGVATLPKAL
jgi:hypothetical protein